MLIRFYRSQAVRPAYELYDRGQYTQVIRYCTDQLARPGADPELRLLRGVAYLDQDKPNEAFADFEACCTDPHVGGVAHYYLGNFLSCNYFHGDFQQLHGVAQEVAAWCHFDKAINCGWVEGHIGKGSLLLNRGLYLRDEEKRTAEAAECFRQALAELTTALASPSLFSRKRALGIRASVYYNLGDLASMELDHKAEKALTGNVKVNEPDPRATGSELYQ